MQWSQISSHLVVANRNHCTTIERKNKMQRIVVRATEDPPDEFVADLFVSGQEVQIR